jgi:hypothetical protein
MKRKVQVKRDSAEYTELMKVGGKKKINGRFLTFKNLGFT